MSGRQVISNPFAHNVSVPTPTGSAPPPQAQPSSAPPPANPKYGAPPPAGAVTAAAPPPAYSSGGPAQVPSMYNPQAPVSPYSSGGAPARSVPTGPRYGAPPPAGAPQPAPAQPVMSPLASGIQHQGYQPAGAPVQGTSYPANPQYGAPPAAGSVTPAPQYGAPPHQGEALPTGGAAVAPSVATTYEERALKFPSPVELIANQNEEANRFNTDVNPLPPPAASRFIVTDQGNCGPRYIRSSLYTVPNSADLAKKCALPMGLIMQPLADPAIGEEGVPVVDAGSDGPLRCARCRGYMCSLHAFTNGGRNYTCFLCGQDNVVPDQYFSPLASNGCRMDYLQRPELSRGSVEYVATPEYITKPPRAMDYLFVIEVSSAAVEQEIPKVFASSFKAILNSLPQESLNRYGIITYDSSVHFYNLNSSFSRPRMMVISDLEELVLPVAPDQNLLVTPSESLDVFNILLDNLPQFTATSHDPGNALGAALQLAGMVLEENGGKIIVLQSSLPSILPGKLESRLKAEYLATEREREFYKPQTSFYELLGEKLAKSKVGVDMFVFAQMYVDLATTIPLSRVTGGQLFYYPRFNARRDRIKFHHEMHRVLTRTTGYDGVMLTRVSTGLAVTQQSGHFMLTFGTDMEVANIDCDKTFVIRFRNEGKIAPNAPVGVQCALLYTTSAGQRRIRVHSLRLNSSDQMTNVFLGADLEAVTFLLTNRAIRSCLTTPIMEVRRRVLDEVIQMIYAFRCYCSTKSFNPAILVIPENLKLLPLYLICLYKNVLLKTGRVSVDFRVYSRENLYSTSVGDLTVSLYPRMFALHELQESHGQPGPDGSIVLPPWTRLLNQSLRPNGCYLLDNGHRMFLWVGKEVDSRFLKRVFDADSLAGDLSFNIADDPLANRVKAIISAVQLSHPPYKLLITVKQGGENELMFVQMMMEERVEETMSHSDVLALVHREVSKKLGKPLN